MHHCLAESAGTYAFADINALFNEHLVAVGHARRQVEVLLRLLVFLAHHELFLLGGEVLQAGPSKGIHGHFSLTAAHARSQLLCLVVD